MTWPLQALVPILALVGLAAAPGARQDTYPKNPAIDAVNYAYRLELTDMSDALAGELTLDVRFTAAGVTAAPRPGQRDGRPPGQGDARGRGPR